MVRVTQDFCYDLENINLLKGWNKLLWSMKINLDLNWAKFYQTMMIEFRFTNFPSAYNEYFLPEAQFWDNMFGGV